MEQCCNVVMWAAAHQGSDQRCLCPSGSFLPWWDKAPCDTRVAAQCHPSRGSLRGARQFPADDQTLSVVSIKITLSNAIVSHKRATRSCDQLEPGNTPAPHCLQGQDRPVLGHTPAWGFPISLLKLLFPLCAETPLRVIQQLPGLSPPLPSPSLWQKAVSTPGEHGGCRSSLIPVPLLQPMVPGRAAAASSPTALLQELIITLGLHWGAAR